LNIDPNFRATIPHAAKLLTKSGGVLRRRKITIKLGGVISNRSAAAFAERAGERTVHRI
jgi:hypothetical protein